MTIDFNAIRQAIVREGGPSLEGAGVLQSGAVEHGEAMGFQIETQPDAVAMLTDSLEEISAMFEETEVKNMGDREIGDKRKTENRYTARVRFWTNKLSDMPNSDVIARILRRIRNAGMTTPDQLMRLLQDASEDVTHQFAMLECLEEALSASTWRNCCRSMAATRRRCRPNAISTAAKSSASTIRRPASSRFWPAKEPTGLEKPSTSS